LLSFWSNLFEVTDTILIVGSYERGKDENICQRNKREKEDKNRSGWVKSCLRHYPNILRELWSNYME